LVFKGVDSMTDTTYRTDGFATRRFPGWCVLVYAKPSRVIRGAQMGPWIDRVVFDRDRVTAEARARGWMERGVNHE
jgi:hypothetical protein